MPSRLKAQRFRAYISSICVLILLTGFSALAAEKVDYRPPVIISEEPLTIEQLIELAEENRPAYQQSLSDEELIGELRLGAIGEFLPSINAGATYSNSDSEQEAVYVDGIPVPGTGGTNLSSQSYWYVQASETLFEGLGRYYRLQQSDLRVANTLLGTERAHDLLVSDVKTAAYNYLAAVDALEVEQEILRQRQEVLRLAQTRYETGDVIQLDVMQAEIDLNVQENIVLSAKQAVSNAMEVLNLAVGIDLESEYTVAGGLDPALPSVEADSLVGLALNYRPDLLQTRNQVEISEYDIKQWTSNYFPTASAFVTYSRSESVQDDRFQWMAYPGDRRVNYGLNLNWNIFDRFSREVQREQAVVAKRNAMWQAHQAEQQISADVRRQWRTLNRLFEQIQVAERNRELARRQLELEQERYRVGVSDQLNLRSAQVTFVTAEREYLSRILDFFTTMATLERDLGIPLEEIAR